MLLTIKVVPGEHVTSLKYETATETLSPLTELPGPSNTLEIHHIQTRKRNQRKRKKLKKTTAKKTTTMMKNGSVWIVMSPGMRMVKITGLYVTYAVENIIFCALEYSKEQKSIGL